MEGLQPQVTVPKQKPPAEPPPSPEYKPNEEMIQWMEDVQTNAQQKLTNETASKIVWLQGDQYTPLATKQITQNTAQHRVLHDQRATNYRTQHPQIHQLHIPTPKSAHTPTLYSMNVTDKNTMKRIQNEFDPFSAADITYPKGKSDNDITIDKWNSMVGKLQSTNKRHHKNIEKINICTETVQSDTGANKAVPNNKELLYSYSDIDPYPIGGVKAEDIAIVCTGQGLLPWQSKEGGLIMVRTLYCAEVDGTIISPTTVIEQNQERYFGFSIDNNCDEGKGILTLKNRDGINHTTYDMTMENGPWYHHYNSSSPVHASIRRLNDACYGNLWHGRLAHVGEQITSQVHKHVKGIKRPLRFNPFFKCPSCVPNKLCKVPHNCDNNNDQPKNPHERKENISETAMIGPFSYDHPESLEDADMAKEIGQRFHMDFGFVRGTGYRVKSEGNPTVTSIDGFNSYLIIVDRVSRHIWIFLTTSKSPPIEIARSVLRKFKCSNPHRSVRTDQGKELGKSSAFQQMVHEERFALELTGADASAQNAIAESPNRYLGNMMRCLLHTADLGPEYWSFALLHAVYIKNRIPHTAIKCTPYEVITGSQPDLTNLRTFGCRIYAKKPGKRPAKLDHHTSNGIFLGYKSTMKNVYYIDEKTSVIKIGVHAIFDEAHFTVPKSKTPMTAQALQCLGYHKPNYIFDNGKFNKDKTMEIQLIHTSAIEPKPMKDNNGIIEMYSPESITIPAGSQITINTYVAITPSPNNLIQILPSVSSSIQTESIQNPRGGSISIKLHNTTQDEVTIKKGECIAKLAQQQVKRIPYSVTRDIKDNTIVTTRDKDSNTNATTRRSPQLHKDSTNDHNEENDQLPHTVPYEEEEVRKYKGKIQMMTTAIEQSYQISLSSNPFDNEITVTMSVRGNHETLGMKLAQNKDIGNRIQLLECLNSTPAARIPKWRSVLRNAFLK